LIHPEDKDGEAFDVGQKFRVGFLGPDPYIYLYDNTET
jgi:hypothetical protein